MSAAPHILMCPPEFYGIQYEINPWMNRKRQADHELAARQWQQLYQVLEGLGARISLISPFRGLPDLVFTANAGLVFQQRAILSRFRHQQRQGEEQHYRQWFAQAGFAVEVLPKPFCFEGAGDALFCGDNLFGGYRIRSDILSLQYVGSRLGCRVFPLELIDPYYYHLDTCFCPLARGAAMAFLPAFDHYARTVLPQYIEDLILVEAEEARAFACNAVVVGRTVITNTGCPQLHRALQQRGFDTIETPLSEFVKAGGSAKCLTLRLDGEEAVAWKDR